VQRKPDKILVVDDDPVIRDMMVDILSFEDYPIDVARNGQEALALLRNTEGYLVFLDLMMPVMDGHEVCGQLNADPALRQRHVIILMSALDNLAQAAALNVDATMPKPFSVDDVMLVIQPFME
jgi:CheY-like chemotaxis protein